MDFEKQRQAVMKRLNEMKQKKAHQIKRKPAKSKPSSFENEDNVQQQKEKLKIIVFGEKSPFLNSLRNILTAKYELFVFNNSDKAAEACIEQKISIAILDFDKPTDYLCATDVFTIVRTMMPESKIIVCTMNPFAISVRTIMNKGAIMVEKPVDSKELYSLLDE